MKGRLMDSIRRDFGFGNQEFSCEKFRKMMHLLGDDQIMKILEELYLRKCPSFLKIDLSTSVTWYPSSTVSSRQIYSSFSEVHTRSKRVALVYSRRREIVARYRARDRDRELEISRTEISCSRSPRTA